jgi:xylulose-5-phosphate/fructose-6-phosphate phosphoketolase
MKQGENPITYDLHVIESIKAFWEAANYISVCLLYLKENPMLHRPLILSDVKPRAVGHWGCVPSLNFIWATLLCVIRSTNTDVRLFLGTGHAGAAWLACSYLEGSLSYYYEIGDDEISLTELSSAFGRTGGYLTELSTQYPGVLWSSGELGYTLGIAHGHSLSTRRGVTIAVLGDGELETAPTSASFQAIRKFVNRPSRLVIIVNLNGLRMGSSSEISTWTDHVVYSYFIGLGLQPHFIEGFDVNGLCRVLSLAVLKSKESGSVQIILLRTPKGATIPISPDGESLLGTTRSHKAPIKKIREASELEWLENWLYSYKPQNIFKDGRINRSRFDLVIPSNDLLIGTVHNRIEPNFCTDLICESYKKTAKESSIESFVETLGYIAKDQPFSLLLTSPDELSSNRLNGLKSKKVEIIEYLSEHQCLAWSIGAITASRATWYTTYDAFAPIVSSMVTQYLKFLDSIERGNTLLLNQPLNIFLTSLGWRNVYSHQDPGFASSLLEKNFSSFRCFLPTSPGSMAAVVRNCHISPNRVNCVIADKYFSKWQIPESTELMYEPFRLVSQWGLEKPNSSKITFLVAGDYLVREAMFAAEFIELCTKHVATQVISLEELTWLYRSDECSEQRRCFEKLVAKSDLCVLVTSLYKSVVSNLIRSVIPKSVDLISSGYRSSFTAVTSVDMLFESQSSWIQLAEKALDFISCSDRKVDDQTISTAINQLNFIENKLREELIGSYDEPEWYWDLQPKNIFI